jgi:CRISPR-associated protein Cmr4
MTTRLTLVHAMSPLHAGTGQSVGAIDLPIAREKPTGVPLLPGSSLKGALRALSKEAQITRDVFGPETAESSAHAGSVQFSDVHLLLLPVRSIRGTFAWVTSPYLLGRFSRNAREAGVDLGRLPAPPAMNGCRVLSQTLSIPFGNTAKVVFEDLDFLVEGGQTAELEAVAAKLGQALFPDGSVEAEPWRASLRDRLCLIHDDIMSLLLETATEVNAHIRLSPETKTVERGALWYQESLPAESVLSGIVVASDAKPANGRSDRKAAEMLDHLTSLAQGLVQLGGKSTVGQGSCFLRLAGGRS